VGTSDDRALIRQAALDYFEGWFDGDAERMDRALHPNLSSAAQANNSAR
jgi:hypothetical protein